MEITEIISLFEPFLVAALMLLAMWEPQCKGRFKKAIDKLSKTE